MLERPDEDEAAIIIAVGRGKSRARLPLSIASGIVTSWSRAISASRASIRATTVSSIPASTVLSLSPLAICAPLISAHPGEVESLRRKGFAPDQYSGANP